MSIRVGVQLHPQHCTYEEFLEAAKACDKLQVDSLWLWDHFYPLYGEPEAPNQEAPITASPHRGAHWEAWTLLTAIACHTSKPQIGHLVGCNSYRNPQLVADMARSVDHISGGRVVLGIGSGWFERDYTEYGYEFGTAISRLKDLGHNLPIIRERLAKLNPPPVQKSIPLMIGGGGEKVTLKLVALYGDACNIGADVAAEKLEILKGHCDKVGRNYDEITKSSSLTVYPIATGADPMQATAAVRKSYGDVSLDDFKYYGTPMEPAQIVERVQKMQADGIDYVINYIPGLAYDLEPMKRYEEEVIPHLS